MWQHFTMAVSSAHHPGHSGCPLCIPPCHQHGSDATSDLAASESHLRPSHSHIPSLARPQLQFPDFLSRASTDLTRPTHHGALGHTSHPDWSVEDAGSLLHFLCQMWQIWIAINMIQLPKRMGRPVQLNLPEQCPRKPARPYRWAVAPDWDCALWVLFLP